MQAEQLESCRQALKNRWPLIGGWWRMRAVRLLAEDGSAPAVRMLAEAAGSSPSADPMGAVALDALCSLAAAKNEDAREALCRLVIDYGQREAEEEVLAEGYLPRDASRRALLCFLTEQWDKYESLDFDHALLRAAYETGSESLRRRIAAAARAAGRMEWVEVVAGSRLGRRLGSLTDIEWRSVLTVLQDNERWPDLWRLAQEAPPRWSARILRRLTEARWNPADGQRQDFAELAGLAEHWQEEDADSRLHCLSVLRGHGDEVGCLAFIPRRRLIASGGGDRTVRLWGLPEGETLQALQGPRGPIHCLATCPRGRVLAAGAKDGTVWLWQLPGGRAWKRLSGHSQAVRRLAITPDASLLASGGADGGIQLWDLRHAKAQKTLAGHDRAILDMAISPDGRVLASAGADSLVRLWSLPDGRSLRRLDGHRAEELDAVTCLAISPDSQVLASGGTDGLVQLWSLPGGQSLRRLKGHNGEISSLAVSPDGRILASGGGEGTIGLWDLPSGDSLDAFEAHSGGVTQLGIYPSGRVLVSASGCGLGQDHRVRLWSLPGGRPLRTLHGHGRYVTSLAISPDGMTLASGSGDGTVRLWVSELTRLGSLPVGRASLRDLERLQSVLAGNSIPDEERRGLEFMAALIRRHHRHDIVVEEAAPRVVEIGSYDIEIEG
jgi:WD40 repeat protein